jgi:hypothetical protein
MRRAVVRKATMVVPVLGGVLQRRTQPCTAQDDVVRGLAAQLLAQALAP